MTQENVETLRAFSELLRDITELVDALKHGKADLSALVDADVIYEDQNLPDHIGESYRGYEGLLRAAERWADASEDLTVELDRIIGSGDVLVSIHSMHSKARSSGIEFDAPLAYVWTFRDGKIVHFQSYRDPAKALEVAGLAE